MQKLMFPPKTHTERSGFVNPTKYFVIYTYTGYHNGSCSDNSIIICRESKQ